MKGNVQSCSIGRDWTDLYMAAIFEDDKEKILSRVARAEEAVAARAAELSETDGTQIRERKAVENAIYFLRLLRKIEGCPASSCEQSLQFNPSVAQMHP